LIWAEQGGRKVEDLARRGFGTELIERGIRFEVQGKAEIGVVDGGLHCRIVIPENPQYIAFGSPLDRRITEGTAS